METPVQSVFVVAALVACVFILMMA